MDVTSIGARASYSPTVKAQALAALLAGGRPCVVAREHGIPESTVRTWRRRLRTGRLGRGKNSVVGRHLLGYLEESLRALTVQCQLLADPDRLHELRAGEVAILHGKMFDRSIRILEMMPATDSVTP